MLATGWDWPTLMQTPEDIVRETMIYHQVRAEYMEQQAKQPQEEIEEEGG
jgi:hypothetical protein